MLTLFLSCTDDEKRLNSLAKSIPSNLIKVDDIDILSKLEVSDLERVKIYTDSLNDFTLLIQKVSKKRSTKKRIRKALLKNSNLSSLCSTYFLEKEEYVDINSSCMQSHFNVCPISFSKYMDNKNTILSQLKDLLEGDSFNKTDCNSYDYREL
jgi:hypothetical protein